MISKTHLTTGIATALILTQPSTPQGLAAAIIGGALGGALPDIDIIRNKTSIDSVITQSVAAVIAVAAVFADYYFSFGILSYLQNHPGSAVTGLVMYGVLMVIGFYAPHRGFTHSLLGLFLFSSAIGIVYPSISAAYVAGYVSHLALDLLNKKPVQLFFPLKKGICLKLCYSNREANDAIFHLANACMIAFWAVGVYRIIGK